MTWRDLFQTVCGIFGHPWPGKFVVVKDDEVVGGWAASMTCRICGCPLNPMYHK